MTAVKETTTVVLNLWCAEGNHDKLYRLEMSPAENGRGWNVISAYCRRGGKISLHVWADGVSLVKAKDIFYLKAKEKYGKGYRAIKEDVMNVGKLSPTRL